MIRNGAYAIVLTFAVVAIAAPAFATDQNSPVQNSPVQFNPVQQSPVLNSPGNSGNAGGPANYGTPVSPAKNGNSSFSNSGNSNCPDCPKPRQHYDTQEVVHTIKDVDHSRVINTISVVPVAPRTKETNHLVIHKNTIRNVGVVQHNHTFIEKEIRYKRRPVQRSKVVGTIVQEYQTVYKPAIVYVPYTYPVRYAVPHHHYPKQYHYPQHHYQQSCCQQHQHPQQYYPQPQYQQPNYYRTGLLQWREY